MSRAIVIGAGVGGLTTAASLAGAGVEVDVLEAHVYPGGCAGTFYYQGYRFDAGATLAGGFAPGGLMDQVGQALGIEGWPVRPTEPAMVVHLPDGTSIPRRGDADRWKIRKAFFSPRDLNFWRWQERTADVVWNLARSLPPWPPQSPTDLVEALRLGSAWWIRNLPDSARPGFLMDALRPAAAHLSGVSERLRTFLDGQLLISAQAESARANALYAAAALDLPRQGVAHLEGGMGALSERLVQAVREHHGRVHYRQEVVRVRKDPQGGMIVETRRGADYSADLVVFNLPPWNVRSLLEGPIAPSLDRLPDRPERGWGAFMIYLGVDESWVPDSLPAHHQILAGRPLAEGNSIFLSINPAWDRNRAPFGKRTLTISTHTALKPWWALFDADERGYQQRKQVYAERILATVARTFPGVREAAELILPATPITFKRFTRREWGWVGGFPQTGLAASMGPRLGHRLWMVGDSVFPGQSTPAVAMGGLRVGADILSSLRPGRRAVPFRTARKDASRSPCKPLSEASGGC